MLSTQYEFVAPEYILKELQKHKSELLKKSKIALEELNLVYELIQESIIFYPKKEYEACFSEVESICPDPKDIYYLALAKYLNCPIISNDKELKAQAKIAILSARQII